MNIKKIGMAVLAILSIALTSCKKKFVITPTEKGTITLQFENLVNTSPLVLNTQNYTNANGDTFNISSFKYYVSNFILTKVDGSTYQVPESYILVDAANISTILNNLIDIPAGDYNGISFTIGLDKERDLAGLRNGIFDPAMGMFWSQATGYAFVKMEGTSPQSTLLNQGLSFQIGGVANPYNTIRTFTTTLSNDNPIRIRVDKNPKLHFKVNAATLFTGTQNINFATLNTTKDGPDAVTIANNYAIGLFKLDHIHN